MNNKDARFNHRMVLLVLASFIVFVSVVILRIGIGSTPYDTTDSAGRSMGFNDPLYAEHYLIILRNFNPTELLKQEYVYEWVLVAAHILGAGILLSCGSVCSRLARWFFAAQALLFPLGCLALPFLPFLIFTGRMDREGFVDIPFIVAITHPVWVVTSLIIAFTLRGNSLGVSRIWNAISQAFRAGAGTFAKEMR